MSEVWEALDAEYAQEEEVVNAVNAQLRKLRSTECSTPAYIVDLRNHLPVLQDALQSVNGLEHLQTPDKVSFLVEKFDDLTQREWQYYKSKNSGKTWDRFFSFILDRYDSCRSTIACNRSRENLIDPPNIVSVSPNATSASCVKCLKWVARGGAYTCPACGHQVSEGNPIGHCLEHCPKYVSMSANQRSDCVRDAQWCPVHLSATHSIDACAQKNDPRYICGIDNCDKHHHQTLHSSTTTFISSVNAVQADDNQSPLPQNTPVLLSMQSIRTTSGNINCFFDDGSDCTLILNSAAQRLGLRGEDIMMQVTTVIGMVSRPSKVYNLTIFDRENKPHKLKAFGFDNINGKVQSVEINGVKELFSQKIQEVWDQIAARPSGEVELLIGSDHLGLHPSEIEVQGNLKVYKSKFASGYVIVGKHPALKSNDISSGHTNTIHVSLHATKLSFKSIRDYFDANELNVEVPRRCNNCMSCSDCSFRGQLMSLREQYEYEIMLKNVSYDEVLKVFLIKYPFLQDPSILINNFYQVVKIAEREEKKLFREGLMEGFNGEFVNMLLLGVLIELSKEYREKWKGPVRYTSLQHVVKPSPTTPIRIVSNSSLTDRNGNSLNSIMMKGPNALSDQRDVVSRWRSYESAVSSDLTKAYYAMKTGELELNLRRVVWRYGKTEEEWRHFGFATVSFGDKPAGVFLDIVINQTADKFQNIDPVVAQKIKEDRYVDDMATGGSPLEVQRMVGERVNPENKFETNGTLATILSNGSLNLKAVVASGEEDTEVLDKLGNSVLGINWDATSDVVNIDMGSSPALTTLLNTDDVTKVSLTMRDLLRMINKPHDVLGLVSPITIQAMVAYRNLFRLEPALGWDDQIPAKEKLRWVKILQVFHETSAVKFYRSTKPKLAVGDPEVVGYFDGSDEAYAAVVYLRWTLADGSYDVNLACSKAKVTPLKRISTPRSELNGAVLLSRLLLFYVKSCSKAEVKPRKVWFLGDSECTLATMEKTSGALGEYFGNRRGEILDNLAKIRVFSEIGNDGECYHVPSSHNAADQATRMCSTAESISNNSTWQKGPCYLYEPVQRWPIDRNFASAKDTCIPETEILKRFRGQVHKTAVAPDVGVDKLIDPLSTNDWERLVQRTQALLTPFMLRRGVTDNSQILIAAENLWFKQAMSETHTAVREGKLKSLLVEDRGDLVVVVGRAKTGMSNFLGKEYLPVLMRKTRVAYMVMLWAHKENHDYRDLTMSIASSKAWIVGAKQLATHICDNCVRCRFLHKLKIQQKMAALPPAIQLPCPPFTNVGLDLCGPLVVHAMTNKRATMKVWNVLFVCLNTKAVTMYLAPGYSTKDFFVAYNSHISERGLPNTVHSDRGSQLVAAGKEVVDFDWDAIAHKSASQGTNWDFTPAGAQWRNGAVEIFVKKFKKSFELLYGKTRLDFAEMSCAIKRIANVLNDRPLSVQKSAKPYPDKDFLSPITPNMLLTGRSGSRAPVEYDVNYDDLPAERLSFVEELELSWWCQYKVQYFASLIPTQKWVKQKRNMRVDDLVLIEYKSKSAPGTYRMGRVKAVEVDDDLLVRTCTVTYKLVKPNARNARDIFKDVTTKEIRLPVQRLILILPVEEQ